MVIRVRSLWNGNIKATLHVKLNEIAEKSDYKWSIQKNSLILFSRIGQSDKDVFEGWPKG